MISENLDTVRHEVLAEVHQVQNVVANDTVSIPQVEENNQPPPQIQTTNAVIRNPDMAGILNLITNFTTTVHAI